MIVSLFSVFDPSTSEMFRFNWINLFIIILFLPLLAIYKKYSNYDFCFLNIIYYLYNEYKIYIIPYSSLFFITLYYLIYLLSLLGLFPYVFTLTSHIVFALGFALPLWLANLLYGGYKNIEYILAHIVPLGTPSVLMVFIVMVETVSQIIRPITLAVRLRANIIAGHVLLSLVGQLGEVAGPWILVLITPIQIILYILEIGVAIIQAYVYCTLSVLYNSEVSDKND